MGELQNRIVEWGDRKFPDARLAELGLKAAEEMGEVCKAIDRYIYAGDVESAAGWRENMADELGDVQIVLYRIAARYQYDLEACAANRFEEVSSRSDEALRIREPRPEGRPSTRDES